MAIKVYNPYTPSRRFMTGYDFSDLTAKKPQKGLREFLKSNAGRNSAGRVTIRHRGGGHKRLYRIVDFREYDKIDIPATVESVEYDPHRTCRIVLVCYADGERRYKLAWKNCAVGQTIICGDQGELTAGNRKRLKDIPDGFSVFNLEVTPMTKGKLIKSAGTFATISGKDKEHHAVYIKLPSGEVRKFHQDCWATIGVVGNEEHKNIVIGKAGRMRWMGRRPVVLGKSMNPVDHPHGGGEGHTGIGLVYRKSFSGIPVPPGKKTRNKKWSDKFIVSRRKTKFSS